MQVFGELSKSIVPPEEAWRASYFERYRPEILALVPAEARKILSVGCGAGTTEAALLRRGADVWGIEIDPVSAERARERGICIIGADATDEKLIPSGQTFDCILYADVLEHLIGPDKVLCEHVRYLARGGIGIISVPNFRHYSVCWDLVVRGRIKYTDAGILDRTHLRLTTRRMVENWLHQAGMVTDRVLYSIYKRRERVLAKCSLGILNEFLAQQVIVVGTKE